MTKRGICFMIIMTLLTFGIYTIYWFIVTKGDLNRLGVQRTPPIVIPTAFLFFIPLANFYFLYRFAQSFAAVVLKDESKTVLYFILVMLLMPISTFICQSEINELLEVQAPTIR